MGQTKKYINLFNSYYKLNDNKLKTLNLLKINNEKENIELENNKITNNELKEYVYELTNETPNKLILHKIKQITYHILNITKLLLNNKITQLLLNLNMEPISKLTINIGIKGLTYILNKILLSKIFEELTEEEKNLILSIIKDIKYIYKKSCELLNKTIINIMNSSCCCK